MITRKGTLPDGRIVPRMFERGFLRTIKETAAFLQESYIDLMANLVTLKGKDGWSERLHLNLRIKFMIQMTQFSMQFG